MVPTTHMPVHLEYTYRVYCTGISNGSVHLNHEALCATQALRLEKVSSAWGTLRNLEVPQDARRWPMAWPLLPRSKADASNKWMSKLQNWDCIHKSIRLPSMQHHMSLALYSSPHSWKHTSFRAFEFWEMWNRILLNLKMAFPQVGSAWKRGFSLELVTLFGFVGLPMMSSAVPIHCPLRRWRTSWAAQHEHHRATKDATWCH